MNELSSGVSRRTPRRDALAPWLVHHRPLAAVARRARAVAGDPPAVAEERLRQDLERHGEDPRFELAELALHFP